MDTPLQTALENLVQDKATANDLELLRQAFASGQIFIGGNVQYSVIIVGSGNSVQLSAEMLERLAAVGYLSALHGLRQPPADFVGRNRELKKILSNIEEKGGAAISGLIGMAGIGKTVLGLVVAHSLVNKYPDAQFFIDLRGTSKNPLQPLDVMKRVVQSFYPAADLHNATDEELAAAYQSKLAEKKTILFLDNAQDASQIMPLRPPPNSLMLVTSRLRFTIPGLHPVELDVLNKSDATHLLKEICPRLTRKDAQRIAVLCGNLPIALRLAGSYLQIHGDWSAEEYINLLADKTKRLQALQLQGAGADLDALFEQSYEQLSEEEERHWNALAIFPASFKRDSVAAIWDLDEDTARKLAGKLHQYSLLEYDSITNRYRLHDLLADFADRKLGQEDRRVAFTKHLQHYQKVWKNAEALYAKGGDDVTRGLLLFDTEAKHIETAYEWAAENADSNKDVSALLREIPDSIQIARIRVHNTMQIKWFQKALSAARSHEDRYNQNKLLGFIGVAYLGLGDWPRALEHFEQALLISRDIHDKEREGYWLGNIGNVHFNLGEWGKAANYYEQALEIAREIGDRKRVAGWSGNLAGAFFNNREYHRAIDYYEQARAIAHEIGDLQQENLWLGNMGATYSSLGEHQRAIECNMQALSIARKLGDRAQENYWLGNLGEEHSMLGDFNSAIQFYKQALAIARELGDKQQEGLWLGNLGGVYSKIDDLPRAKSYTEQAIAVAHDIGDREREGTWLNNLGGLYIEFKESARAKENINPALTISREVGIPDLEGRCLFNLAKVFQLEQNQESASQYAQEARLVFESIKSPLVQDVSRFIEALNRTP